LPGLLLLLGAGLAIALSFVLWRTLQLEARARAAELARAEVVAERILQRAPQVAAVMAMVADSAKGIVRDGAVVAEPAIGWLHSTTTAADEDVVVDDRLERAARAEFGAKDLAAAAREFDELLAAALPSIQRLRVLAAACWHGVRSGVATRMAPLGTELDERIAALGPADLGRPAVALAVGAALRLPRPAGAPAWAAALVPFLPEGALAGLAITPAWATAHAAVTARRAALRRLDDVWRRLAATAPWGLVGLPQRQLLWWQPRSDGALDVALLPVEAWFALVGEAGRAGKVAEWPWLVVPDLVDDPAATCGGVPHVRGLRPLVTSSLEQRPWLWPAITFALLLAFGAAVTVQFRAARREAAAVRAQADFLTTVTHELKTPLASIRLLGEMLVEGRARGREADYYRMLAGEAGRLSMLIENVLDLGRVERGERAYEVRTLDVGAVVRETVELLAPQILGVTFVGASTPVPARFDRSALVQALISVLDNARKYGQPPIDVGVAACDRATARITVRDRGPGVPEAERERIFARFVRGVAHAHGSTPGVGIGLYLARTIVRRLGGDLVCGAPGDGGPGALFTFTLPMELSA
jgi:signal transduction histidine kinase